MRNPLVWIPAFWLYLIPLWYVPLWAFQVTGYWWMFWLVVLAWVCPIPILSIRQDNKRMRMQQRPEARIYTGEAWKDKIDEYVRTIREAE